MCDLRTIDVVYDTAWAIAVSFGFFCFAYVIRPGTTSSHTTMEAQLLNICERKKLYLLSFGSRKEQEFLIHKTKKYENDDIVVHFLRQCSARIPVVDGVWASAGHRDVSVSTCHFRTC